MDSMIPWLIALVAGSAALGLYLRLRAVVVELAGSRIEGDKLRGELGSSREQLERSSAKLRRRSEETAELRRKLDKHKRRGTQSQGGVPIATAAKVSELEQEIEAAHQLRDAARDEAKGLSAELSRLRSELAEQTRAAEADPIAETPPATTPLLDNEAIAQLQQRVGETEKALGTTKSELGEARKKLERQKAKARTQEILYASIRTELEAKKDRLRTQQEELERLQALKVALMDPIPGEDVG